MHVEPCCRFGFHCQSPRESIEKALYSSYPPICFQPADSSLGLRARLGFGRVKARVRVMGEGLARIGGCKIGG